MLWAIQENTGEDMTEMARFVLKHDLPSQEDLDSLDESSDPLEALANRLQSIHYSYSKPGSEKDVECEDTGVFSDRELPVKFISEEDFAPLKNLSPEAQYYLLSSSRGLTSNSIIEWELGWQPFVKRIVIPIRDSEKRLVGLSGRTIIDEEPKYLHSPGFKRDYVLYGEHRIIPGDTCYVVEGFFDVIRLYQLGYRNVLGIMGTYISNQQRYKILKHFKQVKIFLDGDLAGKTGANSIYKALHAKISCEIVEPPVDKDPADLDRTVLTSLLGPPTFSD